MDLRCSFLGAKGGCVFVGWGVHVVAVVNFISQIFVDGAGLVADFDLPEPWHTEEEVRCV